MKQWKCKRTKKCKKLNKGKIQFKCVDSRCICPANSCYVESLSSSKKVVSECMQIPPMVEMNNIGNLYNNLQYKFHCFSLDLKKISCDVQFKI